MFEEIDFSINAFRSVEQCEDPAILLRALTITKARLLRFLAAGAPDPRQLHRLVQLLGHLGITAIDESIGAEDDTFLGPYNETHRSPEEIDDLFAKLGQPGWPGKLSS